MPHDIYDNSVLISEAVTVGIRHIGIAIYSSGKIRQYLIKKGYSYEIADSAVASLIERGYIDDYRAAKKIINSRVGRKQESKQLLLQRLLNDGINKNIAYDVISELEDDVITCGYLIDSLFLKSEFESNENFQNLVLKKTRQRGYSSETSLISLRAWVN